MNTLPTIGFVGLGEMGNPIARRLMQTGYRLVVFDLDAARLASIASEGAVSGANVADVVAQSDVIATSLPSSDAFVQVAEEELLPHVRVGQIVIDFGTVTPPETQRLAALFAEKGVDLLDVPLSGGAGGAERGQLYLFAGGKQQVVDQCRPILEAVGGQERLTYCGEAGSGQVVKGINQLMMGIVNAAYLEAISFGINSGIDIQIIEQAIGKEGRWREDFSRIARQIVDGNGLDVGVKFRELPYFLRAADEAGFSLPITQTVHSISDKGERVAFDDHRPAPSYWYELTKPLPE